MSVTAPSNYPEAPHFGFPFQRYTTAAGLTYVGVDEQDSIEEIEACEARICSCPIGGRQARPEFGIPWPMFGQLPIDVAPIQASMQRFEPRGTANPTQYLDQIAVGGGHLRFDIAARTEDQ